MTSRRLVSVAAAAEVLGVCTKTVRRYIAGGQLNGYRLGARMIRVDLAEVESLLRAIPAAGGTHEAA